MNIIIISLIIKTGKTNVFLFGNYLCHTKKQKTRFDLMPYKESYFPDAMQYSIDYKSLHLVSFATEVFFEGSEAQIETSLNWLDQDLKRATQNREKRPWIIVMGHRPLYCSITSNEDCAWKAERLRFGGNHTRGLETLLTKYQVDLYLW